MLDGHTHSTLSHDGRMKYEDLVKRGEELNLEYLATTEHCDRDYYYCEKERFCRQLNIDKYYDEFCRCKSLAKHTRLAFGVEAGYCQLSQKDYEKELPQYPFDVIINSVHSLFGRDVYFGDAFKGKTEEQMLNGYLEAILGSVRATYDYDVIAHFGYIMRYVPYPEKKLFRPELSDKIAEILSEIIARDKCLECNGKVVDLDTPCLPELPILKMYYDLGGRKISFGSDAHEVSQLTAGYEKTVAAAKSVGFTHWTAYYGRQPEEYKF